MFNSRVNISVKCILVCILRLSCLKKHYPIMEEKKRCCYFKYRTNVLMQQSTPNIIFSLNVLLFHLYSTTKMIIAKKVQSLKTCFPNSLTCQNFPVQALPFFFFFLFLKMINLFLLKRPLTINCVEKNDTK